MLIHSLNDKASHHFTFRDLIECGDTALALKLFEEPKQAETWSALSQLATQILDPVVEQFGPITLTYGFCSPALARKIAKNRHPHIAPSLDQHCSHEVNQNQKIICERRGAASDFTVNDKSFNMQQVGVWICRNLTFDRLYYYGKTSPIHISYGPDMNQFVQLMKSNLSTNQRVPFLKGRMNKATHIIEHVMF
ncbi:hypothetical protein G3479_04030 [Shewanella baltica]|uniref:hypothetical protein n=1 Tax=Shewanella baltica TaxID=62322 RepID=UPI00217EB708|nr:hypothetical protein [Shewanella baltica]MCS6258435.1 hypothetical protein [Shewanella baltica]